VATQRPKTRRRKLQSGTVTAVQRVNSDFRLNPHLHVLALDGVFVEQTDVLSLLIRRRLGAGPSWTRAARARAAASRSLTRRNHFRSATSCARLWPKSASACRQTVPSGSGLQREPRLFLYLVLSGAAPDRPATSERVCLRFYWVLSGSLSDEQRVGKRSRMGPGPAREGRAARAAAPPWRAVGSLVHRDPMPSCRSVGRPHQCSYFTRAATPTAGGSAC
jgi:hypothetical protein